ncbi:MULTISPECIES: hypothetical protein [unclassified Lebetimonas]|uniref:hypothetical protein n=1 Tax=unclassified Lebetimonas TaxID=2648158 RepID=UPI000465BEBD|nr:MULTISPECIES: hypothetical protein [unclassified Lebetimonas]
MKTKKLIPLREKALKNKRLQDYLKEHKLTFSDVNILELTDKGWEVLQKGLAQIEILIISGTLNLILPL